MINSFKIYLKIKKNLIFNKNIDYLLKYKFFYNKKIKIFYPLLVPQNDTELIIDLYNKIRKIYEKQILYDLGYGSNNINTSIKKKTIKTKFISIDKNFLCYITKNKKNVNKYIFNDWIFLFKIKKKCNTIISNPPYIEKKELNLKEKDIKKKYCLLSNKNGVNEIHLIIKNSKTILKKNGTLMLEHSYNQSKNIRKFSKLNGFIHSQTLKDHNNIKRLTLIEI